MMPVWERGQTALGFDSVYDVVHNPNFGSRSAANVNLCVLLRDWLLAWRPGGSRLHRRTRSSGRPMD